jgi:hypothetical protein
MASLEGFEPTPRCLEGIKPVSEMLNKMPVSQIAVLSKLSKSYILQVKSGKRPISQKLVMRYFRYYPQGMNQIT